MTKESRLMPSGKDEHHRIAAESTPAHIAVVTVSDTRTKQTDVNGKYLADQIRTSGNELTAYEIVSDEPLEIESLLEKLIDLDIHIILFNGGSGISKRDSTFDVLSRKLQKVLPGFGELFRMLSYEQVGAAAMFSRATAGIYRGKVVISTPGSPAAVQLAWEKLVKPELKHLVFEMER